MAYLDPMDPRGVASKRAHYERNKEAFKARAKVRRDALLQEVREAKSTPCTDCGSAFPHYVMHFDHLPQFEKAADVSRLARDGSRQKVLAEIAKCEVVCANCHAERTWQRTIA